MSMMFTMHQAPEALIKEVHEKPERLAGLLTGPPAPESEGFFSRLFGRKQSPIEDQPVLCFPADCDSFDLDKSWNGIHFLLTESDFEGDPPLSFILNWGREIGEVDFGFGAARSFSNEQVRELNLELKKLSNGVLRERFDPGKMRDVYALNLEDDPDAELEWLFEYIDPMREFIERTANKNFGLIVYLY